MILCPQFVDLSKIFSFNAQAFNNLLEIVTGVFRYKSRSCAFLL